MKSLLLTSADNKYWRPLSIATIVIICFASLYASYELGRSKEKQTFESLKSQLAQSRALAKDNAIFLPSGPRADVVQPATDWKVATSNTFTFTYPAIYDAPPSLSPGVVEIPNFLYIEAAADVGEECASFASIPASVILPNGISLHYQEADRSFFSSNDQVKTSDLQQGVICNANNTRRLGFQFVRTTDALSALATLKMITTPWNLGINAELVDQ